MNNRSLDVFLFDKKVGRLWETQSSSLRFKYDDDAKTPISVRMPIQDEVYPNSFAKPFFENLTPEAEIKTLISKNMGVSENNPLSLLDKIGGDCAGAISLFEEGKKPVLKNNELVEIAENDFINIIKKLPNNPLLTGINEEIRLSLAGAQPKFAVVKKGDKFYYPTDNFPSTHIIKIKNKNIGFLLENEFFCMKLAKLLNIPVPEVELRYVKDIKYLVIERYDRKIEENRIKRIHQEDFCQIQGYLSDKKYQADGGPSIKSSYKAIEKYVNYSLALNIKNFVEIIMFNYLIGNNDAHAKNFSILHRDEIIILAPFYDLISTRIYPNLAKNLAMAIGGEFSSDKIWMHNFVSLANELGLKQDIFNEILNKRFENIVSTAKNLQKDLNEHELTASPIYDKIIDLIESRIKKLKG